MKWTTYVTLLIMIIATSLYVFWDDYIFNQNIKPPIAYETDTSSIDYEPPYQDAVSQSDSKPFEVTVKQRTATLIPRAYYEISGLLIAKNTYFGIKRFSNIFDTISPIDIGIAWGDMAQKQYIEDNFTISAEKDYSDGGRYVYVDAKKNIYGLVDTVPFSNTHIIPHNRNILNALLSAKKFDEIFMTGVLVDVSIKGKVRYETSLTRYDNGAGACEIMYVTEVRINDKLYH